MARTGPDPPDMDWARLDLRGVNSTRNAWGYLSPEDDAIVDDEGRIFIRVDRGLLERLSKKGGFTLKIVGDLARVLARCLRWSKIVKDVMEFNEEGEVNENDVVVIEPTKTKKRKPDLNPQPKKKFKLSRYPSDSTEWDNLD